MKKNKNKNNKKDKKEENKTINKNKNKGKDTIDSEKKQENKNKNKGKDTIIVMKTEEVNAEKKEKKKLIKKNSNILLPNDFNWHEYINLHNDLKNMNQNQAKKHYIKHGYYEGRIYKKKNKNNIKDKIKMINIIGLLNINCSTSENCDLLKNYYENNGIKVNMIDISQVDSDILKSQDNIICIQPFDIKNFTKIPYKPKTLWVWELNTLPYI